MSLYSPDKLREEFWKKDIEDGGVIYSQYQEIKRVLKERDMVWVLEQYNKVKQHAIEQTEFYKSYSVEDDFPVMDKAKYLANYDAITAKDGYLQPTHISSTSGSTGTPFSVMQDYKKRKRTIADLKVFGERCDYPSHERMIFFRVLSEKLHRTPEQEDRENIYYVDSSDLGAAHLEEMRQIILEKKPRIIFSYASTLVELAKYIETTDSMPEDFSMQSVLTAGEGISEPNRKFLERVFGCKVYRRYSDMELGIIAQDMGDGGAYFLNYGSYYFECLKIDSDEPTESGEVGRIVVTDLFNYAFPMIRYDTGDLGIMEKREKNEFPVLKEIYGRSRDCVYSTSGTLISPAKIFVTMWEIEGVKQWQFIQETRDEYCLKLNCVKNIDVTLIIEKIKSVLGNDANICVQYVDEIPVLSSNKRKAIVCNYKKEL